MQTARKTKAGAWEEVAREAGVIQRDFEQALAEWYLFAPDDSVLDPVAQKKLHD